MNESGILTVLEQLLEEFFNSTASNARKHEIERQLGQVKNLPEFGKLCLFIITNSSSQLATMFALSSLEVSQKIDLKSIGFYRILFFAFSYRL